jgi:Flp pilus assembly protein TadG
MDTIGTCEKRWLKNSGLAVVYLAILLVVLIAFAGLAVDLGYMYVTKTQLQNASDAAALAGAAKLNSIGTGAADQNDLVQTAARAEATAFAADNQAAGTQVVIENDDSNTLGNDNDIAVGNWNGTVFQDNTTPVNAIKVRARRTEEAPGGKVSLFFARVLGWNTMGAAAEAVATTPIRATNFIAICTKACEGASTNPDTPDVLSPPRQYDRDPTQVPDEESFAWTSLLQPVSSVPQISPLICTETPNVDVCGRQIWTTQGEVTDLFRDMEGAFNDPNFDRANKEFTNGQVSGWWIIAPVTYVCKPGNQPAPFDVWGYALLRVTSVCDIGGGQPCRPFKSTPCNYPKKVVIDRIACVTCANAANALGFKPILVQ